MEKYLSIPVIDANGANSQDQLISIAGIRQVGQPTTTTVSINYLGGKTATLTWPAAYSSPQIQLSVQLAVRDALASGWTNLSHSFDPKGLVPGKPVINPLTSIVIA
jgi:hypothetical protein